MRTSHVKFYQTGTFTVGNRLLSEEDRSVQATLERTNSLNSGHRACQGCGEALGARYAIDAAMRATNNQLIAANATGCLEVFSTPYPETSWQIPWIHSLFGNAAAVATGGFVQAQDRLTKRLRQRARLWERSSLVGRRRSRFPQHHPAHGSPPRRRTASAIESNRSEGEESYEVWAWALPASPTGSTRALFLSLPKRS